MGVGLPQKIRCVTFAAAKAALLLLAGLNSWSCSNGKLDSTRDRYLSVFGLTFSQPGSHKGGVLARAVTDDGAAAPWSQVYAKPLTAGPGSNPVIAMTNEKGGFYLGNLEPETYQLFVLSPSGQGAKLQVDIKEGEVIENERLSLGDFARIYGHVKLENEPANTGVMIYVPGTPFSAFSDQEGSYYLDVPKGAYELVAERDNFSPFASDVLDVEDDLQVDIVLQPNPWPNGSVKIVNSEDGYVVRGLQTHFLIAPVPGVRHMRVVDSDSGQPIKNGQKLTDWLPVKKDLVLTYKSEGSRTLDFEFMDAYGKRSEPVLVSFYNTKRDKSWTLLHGVINRPVVIKQGQNVAFLAATSPITASDERVAEAGTIKASNSPVDADTLPGGDEVEAPNPSSTDSRPIPKPHPGIQLLSTASGRASSTSSARETTYLDVNSQTIFLGPVTIESGVHLQGGAFFLGPLIMNGTNEQPILWEAGESGSRRLVKLSGEKTVIKYTRISNTVFITDQDKHHDAEFDHVDLNEFELSFNWAVSTSGGSEGSAWTFRHSHFADGYVGLTCNEYRPDSWETDLNGKRFAAAHIADSFIRFEMNSSVFSKVGFSLDCLKENSGVRPTVKFDHNNFFETRSGEFYFTADLFSGQQSDLGSSTFPNDDPIDYHIVENYFREPSPLFPGSDQGAWPTFFGVSRDTPWADVGF